MCFTEPNKLRFLCPLLMATRYARVCQTNLICFYLLLIFRLFFLFRQFAVSDSPRYRVFVGNLPKASLQSHIEDILDGCKISEIQMIRNTETDEFRGFAYVELKDEESYTRALSYDGTVRNNDDIIFK